MPEYFEITFFLDKQQATQENAKMLILDKLQLAEGNNSCQYHPFSFFSKKEVVFEFFDELDFFECCISMSDTVFTHEKFMESMQELIQVVAICFQYCKSIQFATGIYELTYYLTREIVRMEDLTKDVFSKFPFVFLREGCQCVEAPYCREGGIVCVYNSLAQNIFADSTCFD